MSEWCDLLACTFTTRSAYYRNFEMELSHNALSAASPWIPPLSTSYRCSRGRQRKPADGIAFADMEKITELSWSTLCRSLVRPFRRRAPQFLSKVSFSMLRTPWYGFSSAISSGSTTDYGSRISDSMRFGPKRLIFVVRPSIGSLFSAVDPMVFSSTVRPSSALTQVETLHSRGTSSN